MLFQDITVAEFISSENPRKQATGFEPRRYKLGVKNFWQQQHTHKKSTHKW